MSLPAPFYSDPVATLYCGDNRTILPLLPDRSVHCCVTSPPYFGLRDYGHEHQIGLEQTPDAYVAELVRVFREVKRVLRDDGTLWLNLGDSYVNNPQSAVNRNGMSGSLNNGKTEFQCRVETRGSQQRKQIPEGLKPKDLFGIPWRVAFALQADGWYLRQDIIWHKPNPMPESVTDRCTKAHEYIFLLSKSERYYFGNEAIQEPSIHAGKTVVLGEKSLSKGQANGANVAASGNGNADSVIVTENRNKRSVWTVPTKPFPGAHFAVFPPDLIRPCILAGCPEGGTVLEPFNGSGTTMMVAKAARRHAIGIDGSAEYCAMAARRVAQQVIGLGPAQQWVQHEMAL